MLYIGIDVATKNKYAVTALNDQGEMFLKPLTFSNTRSGFEFLDKTLRQLKQD
ncbi:Mobile element protein [Streptococcus oralis]|uniref:Mobile element protein n=1 Tax=Streptococcus oralis TaxID=1303 RepID=A0A139PB00_STROR|nr:Mobile element protein [Streptococcus oralis]